MASERSLAVVLVTGLFIITFIVQAFEIPSSSMENTLLVGDYLFVSKYSYGYSHYSIPLSPPPSLRAACAEGAPPANGT